jgi:hypothetical protein
MATKILRVVQDIAHDQLTVYSTLQNLINTNHVYSDEIKDYEVTPFGANQFLISLIFLWLQQEWAEGMIKLQVGVARRLKKRCTKAIGFVVKTIKTFQVNHLMSKTSTLLLTAVKAFRIRYKRSINTTSVLITAVLVHLVRHYWSADTLLVVIKTFLSGFSRSGTNLNLYCVTTNYRAWYNGVEVEQG